MAIFYRTNIASGYLNVREGADIDAPVVFTLKKDEIVAATVNVPLNGFLHISRGSQLGYAYTTYLAALHLQTATAEPPGF